MNGKLILAAIFMIAVCRMGIAQNGSQIFQNVKTLFNNLDDLNGNMYFFNGYGKLDTSYFSDSSLRESIGIIKRHLMRRASINFDSLSNYIPANKIKDEISFGKTISSKPVFNVNEISYSIKLDSFFTNYRTNLKGVDPVLDDSLASIEKLLMSSSHINFSRKKVAQARKKLLKILAVYESDNLEIIIYSIYVTLADSYINSELILKHPF